MSAACKINAYRYCITARANTAAMLLRRVWRVSVRTRTSKKGNWYGECPREVNRWNYDVPGVGMRMIPSL